MEMEQTLYFFKSIRRRKRLRFPAGETRLRTFSLSATFRVSPIILTSNRHGNSCLMSATRSLSSGDHASREETIVLVFFEKFDV